MLKVTPIIATMGTVFENPHQVWGDCVVRPTTNLTTWDTSFAATTSDVPTHSVEWTTSKQTTV